MYLLRQPLSISSSRVGAFNSRQFWGMGYLLILSLNFNSQCHNKVKEKKKTLTLTICQQRGETHNICTYIQLIHTFWVLRIIWLQNYNHTDTLKEVLSRGRRRNNIKDRSRTGSTMTAHPTVRLQGGGDKCTTGAKTCIRLPKEGTTMGTWNIHSLHACRKVQGLTLELKCYPLEILVLAKIRQRSFGETTKGQKHTKG